MTQTTNTDLARLTKNINNELGLDVEITGGYGKVKATIKDGSVNLTHFMSESELFDALENILTGIRLTKEVTAEQAA